MSDIVLCRVDSRLIHGQVMTKWVQQSGANKIIIISDSVCKDMFLLEIYKMSAPPGIAISCYGVQEAIECWGNQTFGEGRILLLFADIKTLFQCCEQGIEIQHVQIGGLGGGPKRKVVYQNITLDDADANMLMTLQNMQIHIIFQTIPEDRALKLSEALDRFEK